MKFNRFRSAIAAPYFLILSLGLTGGLTACSGSSSEGARNPASISGNPSIPGAPAPSTNDPRAYVTDALLFAGDGTWSPEVASIESLLLSNGARYRKVYSAELGSMSVDEIAEFGLMIFPGGLGGTQAGSLSSSAHSRIREAVQKRGVSYIGFCAGAFIAQAPAPAPGGDVSYGLGVVDGPVMDYYHLEYDGVTAETVDHTLADGTKLDILWYGGPVTPNVPGGVIARYPNGEPAISQMMSGDGFVIVSGTHPTATESMLSSLGVSSGDGTHRDFAWALIRSALNRAPMAAF